MSENNRPVAVGFHGGELAVQERAGVEVQAARLRGNHIAVRFRYEWHDDGRQWWRRYGSELWEFESHGLMNRREASMNDLPIAANQRRIFGPRAITEYGQDFPLQ
jgi:nuclear transport factor 2 (NTF2) superfamily protein